MRILYLSVSYVPSRSASSVHVMKMCSAFARQGHEVELVTKLSTQRQEAGIPDDFEFYGVSANFRISKLSRPNRKGGGLVFLRELRRTLQARQPDLVYSRDLFGAWQATRARFPVVYEAHGLPAGRLSSYVARRITTSPHLRKLVVISDALAKRWHRLELAPARCPTLVAHDACDPMPAGSSKLKKRTEEPLQVGYVGHLYPGRGVELIVELAARMPDIQFQLVGGAQSDIERWQERGVPRNCTLHGFVPPRDLPKFYEEFDVLLMPYQRRVGVRSGRSDTAAWMSPMKMFEYLAAGRPILSSNLPVLREVLRDGENAILVEPDLVEQWEAALRRMLQDPSLRLRLAATGLEDFERHHTWSARADRVLHGIET